MKKKGKDEKAETKKKKTPPPNLKLPSIFKRVLSIEKSKAYVCALG